MKRFLEWFLEWWHNGPPMHIHFVGPEADTNPLAERAIESLQRANATLERSLNLVNELHTQLAQLRSELAAYAVSYMDEDAQVAELERMRGKTL